MEELVQRGGILNDAVSPWIFSHQFLNLVDVVLEPGKDRVVSQDIDLGVEVTF